MVSLNPFKWFKKNKAVINAPYTSPAPYQFNTLDGEKFPTGFGPTSLYFKDYWTLRARSVQLFEENLYARGILKRLVTNEINTGLTLESTPEPNIVNLNEEQLNDWTETVENRFHIWGKNHLLIDHKQQLTFSGLQKAARLESLIAGDVLIILRHNKKTNLPVVQLVRGESVRTPLNGDSAREGHRIKHGVEIDTKGRQVAYWVKENNGKFKRVPAYGERSGRRIAWLLYGTEKRLDDVRGQPLLSLVLQSLKEIDRYRDSVQRKAVVNSVLAMFIKKSQDKIGTLPITGGAIRKDDISVTDNEGAQRTYNIAGQIPGMVIEELQQGEEPVAFGSNGTDLNFGDFEKTILQSIAWANELAPEVVLLSFNSNYSASQAAINEVKMYLNKVREEFGQNFCQPIYVEWLISETLLQKIEAPGLLESWKDLSQYDVFGSWTSSDWSGAIKPSTDIRKQAQGYQLLNSEGWITNDRASKELTGTKFSKNIKRLKRENQLKVEAARPLAEFKKEFGEKLSKEALSAIDNEQIRLIVDNEMKEELTNGAS